MNSLFKKLTAFFTRTSPDNPKPSPLPVAKFWEVSSPKDYPRFLQLLPALVPVGSTLYLEGTNMAQDVKTYLRAHPAQPDMAIPRGTIWPKPQCFHMPITTENISERERSSREILILNKDGPALFAAVIGFQNLAASFDDQGTAEHFRSDRRSPYR